MCAKKKASPSKTWKLAGKLCSAALTPAERELIAEDFLVYKRLRGGETGGMPCVTPAMARVHESAAQAVAGFLCQYYAGRFERSYSVIMLVLEGSRPLTSLTDTLTTPVTA